MNPVSNKSPRSYYAPQSTEFRHMAVSHVAATTEDGCTIAMSLGASQCQVSARQADAIAQGLLMAVMRTGMEISSMPWIFGRVLNVSSYNDDRVALSFSDDTIHGDGATFRFFGVCWTYEGKGEDPDYPANALCIRTLHDGGILFGKGNHDYLLTAEQAHQLCHSLSNCAYSLETRSWKIWDKLIEWSTGSASEVTGQPPEEKSLLKHLKRYARSSNPKRKA